MYVIKWEKGTNRNKQLMQHGNMPWHTRMVFACMHACMCVPCVCSVRVGVTSRVTDVTLCLRQPLLVNKTISQALAASWQLTSVAGTACLHDVIQHIV